VDRRATPGGGSTAEGGLPVCTARFPVQGGCAQSKGAKLPASWGQPAEACRDSQGRRRTTALSNSGRGRRRRNRNLISTSGRIASEISSGALADSSSTIDHAGAKPGNWNVGGDQLPLVPQTKDRWGNRWPKQISAGLLAGYQEFGAQMACRESLVATCAPVFSFCWDWF